MNKFIKVAGTAGVLALVATGCSTASTKSDEVALHYNGGGTASQTYSSCVESSKHDTNGPGDNYYYYPKGQRTFSFTGAAGSEAKPLAVTTGDSQTVDIPGFVTFELNTSCAPDGGILRKFHETIGYKYGAYHDGGQDSTTQGWQNFLSDYMAVPLSATLNNAAGSVKTWQDLYNSDAERNKLEQTVLTNLPAALKKTLGDDYIKVVNVSFSKPQADPKLLEQVQQREKNRLAKLAQDEQNATKQSKYQDLQNCRKAGISEQTCLMIYLSDSGKVDFYPIPQGSGINVGGNQNGQPPK